MPNINHLPTISTPAANTLIELPNLDIGPLENGDLPADVSAFLDKIGDMDLATALAMPIDDAITLNTHSSTQRTAVTQSLNSDAQQLLREMSIFNDDNQLSHPCQLLSSPATSWPSSSDPSNKKHAIEDNNIGDIFEELVDFDLQR